MSELINNWHRAERARKNAEEWNELPNGPKYQNDTFKISIGHCNAPMLCRAGQKSHGGTNYWETEKEFNEAILQYLVDGWSDHYPQIMEILRKKEKESLQACQEYIDEMQKLIDESRK